MRRRAEGEGRKFQSERNLRALVVFFEDGVCAPYFTIGTKKLMERQRLLFSSPPKHGFQLAKTWFLMVLGP